MAEERAEAAGQRPASAARGLARGERHAPCRSAAPPRHLRGATARQRVDRRRSDAVGLADRRTGVPSSLPRVKPGDWSPSPAMRGTNHPRRCRKKRRCTATEPWSRMRWRTCNRRCAGTEAVSEPVPAGHHKTARTSLRRPPTRGWHIGPDAVVLPGPAAAAASPTAAPIALRGIVLAGRATESGRGPAKRISPLAGRIDRRRGRRRRIGTGDYSPLAACHAVRRLAHRTGRRPDAKIELRMQQTDATIGRLNNDIAKAIDDGGNVAQHVNAQTAALADIQRQLSTAQTASAAEAPDAPSSPWRWCNSVRHSIRAGRSRRSWSTSSRSPMATNGSWHRWTYCPVRREAG